MSDFRRYPASNTRQIVDYNRFLSLTGTKVFICLDRGVLEIAKYFLNSRAMWRSSYAVSWGDVGYDIPTPEQMNVILNAIAEANEDMASCGQIVTSLDAIANAIRDLRCGGGYGGGSGGAGMTEAAPSGQQTDATARSGPPPDGFSDWAQYDTYACDMAHYIVNQMIGDIATASVLATAGSAVSVLAPLLISAIFTPIPFDDLLVIAALAIEMAQIAFAMSFIITALENNYAALVCAIFSGTSAEQSLVNFSDSVSAAISADPTIASYGTLLTNIAVSFAQSFIQYDSINRIYQKVPYEIPTGQICNCGPEQLFEIVSNGYCFATLVSGDFSDGGVATVDSCVATVFGTPRSNVQFNTLNLNIDQRITLTGFSGSGGGIYVSWASTVGGLQSTYFNSFAEATGQVFDCIGIHIIRLEASNTAPFTLTSLSTKLP